jgi:hypothetical protein
MLGQTGTIMRNILKANSKCCTWVYENLIILKVCNCFYP